MLKVILLTKAIEQTIYPPGLYNKTTDEISGLAVGDLFTRGIL
jgi:hypothetical protein